VDERAERWQARFELPVLVAALLVVPLIVLEQSDVGEPWDAVAIVLNWTTWLVFLVEAVVMIALARWAWVRTHPLDVAIVILTPPFLPASLQAARVLRLLRLVRLVRAVGAARRVFSLDGLRYAAALAAFTALGGGAAFSAIEGRDLNTWDGVWWAMTTMTTVGYGDLYPETDAGRLLAIAVMLVGIRFVAILTAALAERFVAQEVAEAEEEVVGELEDTEAVMRRELREIGRRLQQLERRLGT
jgi:voltage-gated potassium channel